VVHFNRISQEVTYLQNYDAFKKYIDNHLEMPDKMVAVLVRCLEQNKGKLSKKALNKEFRQLEEKEIEDIHQQFAEIFAIEK
jgi:hypothetical protein